MEDMKYILIGCPLRIKAVFYLITYKIKVGDYWLSAFKTQTTLLFMTPLWKYQTISKSERDANINFMTMKTLDH